MKLFTNDIVEGQEVKSIYQTPELKERLQLYKAPDSLVVFDVDDTLARRPTKKLVIGSIPRLSRWITHPEWFIDLLLILKKANQEGWTSEEIEYFSVKYASKRVLPNFKQEYIDRIVKNESPDLFPGVERVVKEFSNAERLVVTRGFEFVASHYAKLLGIDQIYSLSEDKSKTILDHLEQCEKQIERVLVFGDLENDVAVGRPIKEAGYDYDFVQVISERKPYPDATIVIPHNYRVLEDLLVN
ncbi:MAG: hypothetical protein ISS01_00825 [Nanoarchaeota archaeon]|nr:hypothetical protein [Nanoarchaeota archaeon]